VSTRKCQFWKRSTADVDIFFDVSQGRCWYSSGENYEMAEFLNSVVSHPCRRLAHLLCYTLAKGAEDWTWLIRDKRISL